MLFAYMILIINYFFISFQLLLLFVWNNLHQITFSFYLLLGLRNWKNCNLTSCCVKNLALRDELLNFISILLSCFVDICILSMCLVYGGNGLLLGILYPSRFCDSLSHTSQLLISKVELFFIAAYLFEEWRCQSC